MRVKLYNQGYEEPPFFSPRRDERRTGHLFRKMCESLGTAEAEEEVDLKATHGELVKIEKEIQAARDRHNKYLKELGLPPLP